MAAITIVCVLFFFLSVSSILVDGARSPTRAELMRQRVGELHSTMQAIESQLESSPITPHHQHHQQNGDDDELASPSLLEVSSASPGLFYDSANGAAFLRAPYLPATVNGPMYSRSGPQSGAAKAWLEQGAQPPWAALPFGPRTPSQVYVLPFDKMREVQDEFSWNYDHNAPAAPPQFAFAAPIFMETASEQHSTAGTEEAASSSSPSSNEHAELDLAPVEFVQAVEVDDLEAALLETSTQAETKVESHSTNIPDDFWSARGPTPSFSSYINPYYDLTNPSPHGTFADFRPHPTPTTRPMESLGQSGYFTLPRQHVPIDARVAHPFAYHRGALPPFAHEVQPWQSKTITSPSAIHVAENENVETFLSSFVEATSDSNDCINCQFN